MGTLRLEPVLVGDVRDGVGDSVESHERELSLDGHDLVLGARVLELALFLGGSSVAGLVTAQPNQFVSALDSSVLTRSCSHRDRCCRFRI
jgi:hypothetical protein